MTVQTGAAPGLERGTRVLVTGGAGFIGSHLVDALTEREAEVLVVDDLSTGRLGNLTGAVARGCRVSTVDIRSTSALQREFARFRPHVVFHLAAQADVRHSMDDPAFDAAVNITGSVNVFAAAHATGVRRVVNTSTGGAIYGDGVPVPTPEGSPTRPLSAYGLSKRTVEHYADWFRRAHSLDVVTLRYGNVYGPRQDPHGDAGVIAIFCGRALAGDRPVVFGDGQQTRDYVFVADIVQANIAAAVNPGLQYCVYNVGSGQEQSILDLVHAIAEAVQVPRSEFAPRFAPVRRGELFRSCLDTARATAEGIVVDPTPLRVGLATTVSWLREAAVEPGGPPVPDNSALSVP